MAGKSQAHRAEALGEGLEAKEGFEIPDEVLDGVSGGKASSPVCPKRGNTDTSCISGPNGYYVRHCDKCRTSWPYWE